MPEYQARIIDAEIRELIGGVPAFALEGPKAIGKTWSARQVTTGRLALDDPAHLQLAEAAAANTLRAQPKPLLIDEWQRYPPIWDVTRRLVDEDYTPGQYVLTGSAAPARRPMHSGAGRILKVRMRPLAFSERGLVAPTVSLRDFFDAASPDVGGRSSLGLEDYVDELLRSGFPALRGQGEQGRAEHLRSYIDHLVTKDIIEAGHFQRRPAAMREWLSAYAAATATTATWETIRDAATPGRATKPGRRTSEGYREALEALYVVEPLPAWVPSENPMSRLTYSPKHHLADPALACAALRATKDVLLTPGEPIVRPAQGTLLGNLFESLVALSVRVYAQATRAAVHHCRLKGGKREVDFIVTRGRNLVGIEVKLAPAVEDRDVEHLHWLKQSCGDAMCAGIVVTTGSQAYRRQDGIYVVPLALLGP